MTILSEIVEFQRGQFPDGTTAGALSHLEREVRELRESAETDERGRMLLDPMEAVDVIFLAVAVLYRQGYDPDRLLASKLAINRQRTWPSKPNAAGEFLHVHD